MFNETIERFHKDDCTFATCDYHEYGQIHYIPSLAGNVIYLVIFAVLLAAQSFQGFRYKTWGFIGGMAPGLVLEIVGYVGRLQLHHNIFDNNAFILYLIGLTIGPAFLTCAIYLCLGRIINIYGVALSYLKPRTITICFVFGDFLSLLLQAIGGAIAAGADDGEESKKQRGVNILIGGLAVQVASLVFFILVSGAFAWRVFKNQDRLNPNFTSLRTSWKWRGMILSLAVLTITITIRSIYRLIELNGGFDGSLANNQATFMSLEGPCIFVGVILLSIWHPGYVLGTQLWNECGFHLRNRKATVVSEKNVEDSGSESGLGMGVRTPQQQV